MEWKPIETAPLDEDVDFLAFDGYRIHLVSFSWMEGEKPVFMALLEYAVRDATHWMPLPDPPA